MKSQMASSFVSFLLLCLILVSPPLSYSAAPVNTLRKGSSLSVEKADQFLVSPDGTFRAGFYPVGVAAFCFAIWFNDLSCPQNCTVVWMANRDYPVSGKHSKLSLLKTGNLVLTDASKHVAWDTSTSYTSSMLLSLQDSGNLVLQGEAGEVTLWQSFDHPTDTVLPQQPFTKDAQLVSSRGEGNFSSGFYKFFFDNDNVLRLLYHGPEISSIFWPDPGFLPWEVGRSTYNSSKFALLDIMGNFTSSDNMTILAADYGATAQRRLKLDMDGNLRLYSRKGGNKSWEVSWQVFSNPCRIHGTCGPNAVCIHDPASGRKCSCIPGFKMKNTGDWAFGCEREFNLSCASSEATFLQLNHVEFYGYDFRFHRNTTLDKCAQICMETCECKGFQLKFVKIDDSDIPYCYAKTLLLNGHLSLNYEGHLYLKVPKTSHLSNHWDASDSISDCPSGTILNRTLERKYAKSRKTWSLYFLLWLVAAIGAVEILFISLFLIRTQLNRGSETQGYLQAATGFKRFSYKELKKATRNFKQEIGRGAGGTVYKGVLSDDRVAAIKFLKESDEGEEEFLAEVSTVGRLNHMNLIEMWGYCVDGKRRLLVYEFMEYGSLAENLSSQALDWKKRFEIAVGTAKGLAYLHEECLEWVLHCDVKPQNILLDSDYRPKVSDFGLSRLVNRAELQNSSFSRMRGTRGYMAPEWIYKLPITSKVDVYSYGIVVLEMATGKNPAMEISPADGKEEVEHRRLVAWVREKRKISESWVEEIKDPMMGDQCEMKKLETLVEVALQCVEEDKAARPSMSQVVEMLLDQEIDH